MKKVLLTIAAVAFAFAANAQFVVGGQIGFQSNGGHRDFTGVNGATTTEYTIPGNATTKTIDLTIMPKIGYQLNDQMQAGLSFGIVRSKTIDYDPAFILGGAVPYYRAGIDGFEAYEATTRLGWTVAPYFRYNFAEMGNFSVFCEAELSISGSGYAKIHDYCTEVTASGTLVALPAKDTTYNGPAKFFAVGFNVVPGLNYKLGESCSLDLYIDLFRLGFTSMKTTNYVENTVGGTKVTAETVDVVNDFYFGLNAAAQDLTTQFNWFRLGFNFHF